MRLGLMLPIGADRYDADYHLAAGDAGGRFQALDRACAEMGRDPATIMRTPGTRVALAQPGEPGPGLAGVATPPGIATFELRGPPGPEGVEMLAPIVEGLRR